MNKLPVKKHTEILLIEKQQRKKIKLPSNSKKIKQCTLKSKLSNFAIEYKQEDDWLVLQENTPLKSDEFQAERQLWIVPSFEKKHETILLEYQLYNDPVLYQKKLHVYQFELDLQLDTTCFDSPHPKDHAIGKNRWVWGKTKGKDNEVNNSNKQWGAIILADIDQDKNDFDFSKSPKGGISELIRLSVKKPFRYQPKSMKFQLHLETSFPDARYFGLYAQQGNEYKLVLGSEKKKNHYDLPDSTSDKTDKTSYKITFDNHHFYLRANHLPNRFFDGIITLKLKLKNDQDVIAEDHVVIRVAPWLMMPNTQEVKKVHILRINSGTKDEQAKSEKFIKKLQNILGDKLVVADSSNFNGDRWLQDEFVIGYCQGVNRVMPVVCDGPRDRGLDKYPQVNLLKEDFGHVSIAGNKQSTLDSFGNLEVSPPVKGYPFGRIIIGANPKEGFGHSPRQIAHQMKGFLHAQKIQSPVEIFSDWLAVGHVDEIINFVPSHAPSGKNFKMLIASSKKAIDILSYVYFSEAYRFFYLPFGHKKQKSEEVLKKWLHDYWETNHRIQGCLDWNRHLLKKELGLDENDIIDVPVIFKERKSDGRALPLLPNMVNQLVITEQTSGNKLNSFSIAPKSYGPVKTSANGLTLDHDPNNIQYLLEDQLKRELETIGHTIHFVDDVDLYFKRGGDIHCATNVERKYFENKKWWKYKPNNAHDI